MGKKLKKSEVKKLILALIGPDERMIVEQKIYEVPEGVKQVVLPNLPGLNRNNLRAELRIRVARL